MHSPAFPIFTHPVTTELGQQRYTKQLYPLIKKRDELMNRKYINKDNEDSVFGLTKQHSALYKDMSKLQLQFVTSFPDSYFSFELMKNNSYSESPQRQ